MGRGLSSLGDLVNIAKNRATDMTTCLQQWRSRLLQSRDSDPIRALHVSLQQSNASTLHIQFDCNFLCCVSNYELFTGTLYLNDYFLSRGLGASQQSCRVDTYGKAFDLVCNYEVSEILSQEDPGEHILGQEVNRLFAEDPRTFLNMLQKSSALAQTTKPMPGIKRPARLMDSGPMAKRSKGPGNYPDNNALVSKKKVGILMKPTDSLLNKLNKLKELLKEEGITKLHLVPKIDQIAQKTAINIKNVYRYSGIPALGFETRTPVLMEIYFDDVLMASSEENPRRGAAMHDAYHKLAETISSEPVELLATGSRYWHDHMQNASDICHVVTKWQGDDNNCLLTTNLANMKQMMQSNPDFTVPVSKLILTEHQADEGSENIFKMLELSCTRNCMLLECEIVRNPDISFTCTMSLQGKQIGQSTHSTKQGSKRVCSEQIMKRLTGKNDHIYVKKEYNGRIITKNELVEEARRIQKAGLPPAKNCMPPPTAPGQQAQQEHKPKVMTKMPTTSEKEKKEIVDMEGNETLQANIALKPLMPYMATAFYKILDEYYEKVTLDDLMVDIKDLSKSQFEMITHCASRMGLRVISKVNKNGMVVKALSEHLSLLRRSLKAQDISKILQINNGKSGRYEIKKLVHKSTPQELEKFKTEYLAKHKEMVDERENPANVE